jgi:hypothetical protein
MTEPRFMKGSLLIAAIVCLITGSIALVIVWPHSDENDSQSFGLLAALLGVACGVWQIGWWRSMYSGQRPVVRRNAIYSLQFAATLLLTMAFCVFRAITPGLAESIEQIVSSYFLVLSLFAMLFWVRTVGAFVVRTRNHGGRAGASAEAARTSEN